MPSMAADLEDDIDKDYHKCQGRIDRLEVENFKSYKSHQQIGPFRAFTAIIGPNGSGKSNLMDAISFVLGVRTQHLRGSLKELLYSNSEVPDQQRPRRGYVKLVYETDTGEEVHFTRAIHPTSTDPDSNYQSVYKINDKQVTWEAYSTKLSNYGILVKVRNFLVFQGDIEKVASRSPEGLMQLFEQISGSEGLKQQYEALEKEKEEKEKAAAVLANKKKGIVTERRHKKEQKEEAEQYLEQQEELKRQRMYYFLWQLYHLLDDSRAAADEVERAKAELAQLEEQHASYDSEIQALGKQVAGLQKQRMLLEKENKKLEGQHQTTTSGRMRLEAEQERLNKKVRATTRELERAKKEALGHEKLVADLKRDLSRLKEAREAAEAEEPGSGELSLEPGQMAEYKKLNEKAQASTSQLVGERNTEEAPYKADVSQLELLRSRVGDLEGRAEAARDKAGAARAKAAEMVQLVKDKEHELKELMAEKRKADGEKMKLSNTAQQLDSKLRKVEEQLQAAKRSRNQTEKDRKMKATVAKLKEEVPGVYGSMSEVSKVPNKQYQLAVAVALGYNLDAVVVDTRDTAFKCVDILRQNRLERMDFIPLDSCQAKPISDRLWHLSPTAKPAIAYLDFAPELERAFVHACGETLISETQDEARDLFNAERLKVVACDGTLFRPNGTITGGTGKNEAGRARRWDEAAYEELKRQREEVLRQLQALPSLQQLSERCSDVASAIKGKESELKYARADATTSEQEAAVAERDASQLQQQADNLKPELQRLQDSVSARKKTLDKLNRRINAIADRVFADFSKRMGIKSIREFEETAVAAMEKLERDKEELDRQINKVESNLAFEEKKDKAAAVAAKEAALAEEQQQLEHLARKKEEVLGAAAKNEKKVEENSSKAKALQAEHEALEAKRAQLKQGAAAYQKHKSKLAAAVEAALAAEETGRAMQGDVLEAALLEQVDLPVAGGGTVEDAMELDEPEGPSGGSAAAAAGGGVDISTLDYSELRPQHKQARGRKEREALDKQLKEELEERAAELQRAAPNLKAVEQYMAIREKEKEQVAELEGAKQAAIAAAKAFARVKNRRYTLFNNAYQHIKDSIDTIYKQLTSSQVHPLGGTAYLSVENEDDPFSGGIKYTAMPPTKRFRDMEQLSGGEKTVAALALLFAIHSYRPSPFFVLDEVDAALDATNVARVAHYIRNRTRGHQQQQQQEGEGGSRQTRQQQQQEGHGLAFQSIVISLKDIFYEKADALVGVCRDVNDNCSKTFTFDLGRYDPPTEAA